MKVTFHQYPTSQTGIRITPSDSSEPRAAHPELLVDATVSMPTGDRLLAIVSLLWPDRLKYPLFMSRPASERLGDFIKARFPAFSLGTSSPEGTAYTPSGVSILIDIDGLGFKAVNNIDVSARIVLRNLEISRWRGRLMSLEYLAVATNATAFAAHTQRPGARYLSNMAVALMFATDLSAGHMIAVSREHVAEETKKFLVELFGRVGIVLEMASPEILQDRGLITW